MVGRRYLFLVCFYFSLTYRGPTFVLLSFVGKTLSWLCKGKGGVGRILYVSASRHEP